MKTVFVTRKFPPSVGGMERFAYDLYHAIAQKTPSFLVKWGGSNKWLPVIIPYLFVRAFFVTIFSRADLIHVQDGVLAPVGYVLSVLTRKPWVIVVHGLDLTFENKIFRAVNVRCVRKANRVFCISQAAADEATKRGVAKAKIQIIPLGIVDEYSMDRSAARQLIKNELHVDVESYKLLLTTGRLVKRKGVAWFIEHALPDLIKTLPNALYLVVGDGEDRQRIEQIIDQKKMGKHVRMLGKVSDELLAALYKGADIFVMPNIPVSGDVEGFGRVVLEAAASELPVVASGIEGIRDAVSDGKNGVLVPSGDAKSFEKEIKKFADNSYARSFGRKSREFTLKRYEWNAIAEQYIDGYRETMN
jgi:glycosyltransferase involved in cell wall biosynthesis